MAIIKSWIIERLPKRKKRAAIVEQGRRFAIVGAVATTIDIILLNVIFALADVSAITANLIAVTLSTTFSYTFNRLYSFPTSKSKRRTAIQYAAVTAAGIYGIQTVVIWLVTQHGEPMGAALENISRQLFGASFSPELLVLNIAKLLAVGVAGIWNFVMYRRTVFKSQHHE